MYTEDYYLKHQKGSRRSAQEVVPLIMDLVQPKSVIDVGCGIGTWLSVFKSYGVEHVLGLDGEHVSREVLEIAREDFMPVDLQDPPAIGRQFDMAVSLEVAEHLPIQSATPFVGFLTQLAPIVVFSAAIPFQGGTLHVNEQWPDYWAGLFQAKGWVVIDCLRRRIWQNENVKWWYAQNLLLFAKEDRLGGYRRLQKLHEAPGGPLSIVHPKKYLDIVASLKRTTDRRSLP